MISWQARVSQLGQFALNNPGNSDGQGGDHSELGKSLEIAAHVSDYAKCLPDTGDVDTHFGDEE